LAGVTAQAVRLAISSWKLPATTETVAEGRHKGRPRHAILLADVFTLYPAARAAYEAEQAAAAAPAFPVATRDARPLATRDQLEVVLRADKATLERHDRIRAARLVFLDRTVRPLMADCHPMELRRFQGGLPQEFRQAALRWLLTHEEGKALLERLGTVPSTNTIARWWQALVQDPTGNGLKPAHTAAGRPRKTDRNADLETIILGAYGRCRTYRGAAEWLQSQGIAISEATVRRFFARQDPVIERGILDGPRKALMDHGPYVSRAKSLPFQCFSADGHTLDRMVVDHMVHPGEEITSFHPVVYVVYDVGSGAPLALTLGRTLNRYLVLKAIATAILRCGVVPDCVQTDNGSEVKNALFYDKAEDRDYFEKMGARWTLSLPYNAKSKPVERENLEVKRRFAAIFPAYTGGNPSERPRDPLADAIRGGHVDTLETVELQLESWRQAECQRIRTIKGRKILPQRALEEMKAALVAELGPDHPRFIRSGEEWRILPGLKARTVAGFVTTRIEGQVLRYGASCLAGLTFDDLEVRVSPWDVRLAWLTRGNELVTALDWMPDAPALGQHPVEVNQVDLTQLREASNVRKALSRKIRQGEAAKQAIFAMEGKLGGALLADAHANAPEMEVTEIRELTPDDRAAVAALRADMALPAIPAPEPPVSDRREAPASRAQIQSDLDWVLFVLAHPEDASQEEIREVNGRLTRDKALQLQLQNRLGHIPAPLSYPKEA
jgi:hypothetical protein